MRQVLAQVTVMTIWPVQEVSSTPELLQDCSSTSKITLKLSSRPPKNHSKPPPSNPPNHPQTTPKSPPKICQTTSIWPQNHPETSLNLPPNYPKSPPKITSKSSTNQPKITQIKPRSRMPQGVSELEDPKVDPGSGVFRWGTPGAAGAPWDFPWRRRGGGTRRGFDPLISPFVNQ